MFPTASRGSSASRTLSAGKEEDDGAIDPDLGPTMSSASQPAPSSRQSAHAGRASSEGQNNMLSRTLDMCVLLPASPPARAAAAGWADLPPGCARSRSLCPPPTCRLDRTQMNLAAAVDRVDEANLRAQRASDRAASQELAGVKLQQTVEHLKRELEGADATNGRAKKRARPADDESQASTSGQAASPPAPAQGQRSEATRDGKVGELEAEVAALKRAADAARAERQEVVREKDLQIVELQLALDRLKNESSEAANGSEDKLRAGLVKIARLERTVEELETADKRARLASKRADDKDDEVADPKAKLAAAEAVQCVLLFALSPL